MNYSGRNDDRKDDKIPHSRIFIVCSKDMCEEDLREPFERFGDIHDIYMPKDRNTGRLKGVAYIQYVKTSSAAAAVQEMNLKKLSNSSKPIKVMVASKKTDKEDTEDESYDRLFIKVSKQAEESEIMEHFSQFGEVESVHIQKHRHLDESKGLAYVQFKTFLDAAKAFEQCDKKYKAIFASKRAPKELKRGRDSSLLNDSYSNNSGAYNDNYYYRDDPRPHRESIESLIKTNPGIYKSVNVTCSPIVSQRHLQNLFNIIPGMINCKYKADTYSSSCKATITFETERAAAYAVEVLDNYDFPSGEVLSVHPETLLSSAADNLSSIVNSFKSAVDVGSPGLMHLANAIAQASTLLKQAATGRPEEFAEHDLNYCSVVLPAKQPLVSPNTRVAKRCFIVFKPNPPPNKVLQDIFCRFGQLIDISTFPNKTFGFAKYGSVRSANAAISTLNGATVCGVTLKVMEADERPRHDGDTDLHDDPDKKRLKTVERET